MRFPKRFWIVFILVGFASASSALAVWLSLDLNRALYTSSDLKIQNLEILTIKQELYSKFLNIFLIISGLIATLTGILGLGAYELLRRTLDKDYTEILNAKITLAQSKVFAFSYNEFSYTQFRIYEDFLQEKLTHIFKKDHPDIKESDLETAIKAIDIALEMINLGRNFIEELSDRDKKVFLSSANTLKPYVNLLNGCLYAHTSRSILLNQAPSFELIKELEELSNYLYDFALGQVLSSDKYNWWESVETIAFFRIHMGRIAKDNEMVKRGKQLIRELEKGNRLKTHLKPVPHDVSTQVKREYFDRGIV